MRATTPLTLHTLATSRHFLHLSDLHLDPYYGTQWAAGPCLMGSSFYGTYGCDAPFSLLEKVLQAARVAVPEPAFIAVTGDYVRHFADAMPGGMQDIVGVVRNITLTIDSFFPRVPQLCLPGNNDFDHNYHLELTSSGIALGPDNPYLSYLANVAFMGTMNVDSMITFRHGGFYSQAIEPGLHAIVLNTIPYSKKHSPPTTTIADPFGQFAWLKTALSRARSGAFKVFIFGHIPPGLDSFAQIPSWDEGYVSSYVGLIMEFSDVVTGQFFGHLHGDEFRTFSAGVATPILVTSAVTPVYSNNPSFRVISYNLDTKIPTDYFVMAADLASFGTKNETWVKEYNALGLYHLNTLDNESFRDLARSFLENDILWERFRKVYKAMVPQPECSGDCRLRQICVMLSLTRTEFESCLVDLMI